MLTLIITENDERNTNRHNKVF